MHPELMNRYKDSQTCSLYVSRMMMSKIFDVRWYQALLSADEPLSDKVLEGFCKSKLKVSVQLQTVLALYDPETVRNGGQTSYSRLKTSVRLFFWPEDEKSEPTSKKTPGRPPDSVMDFRPEFWPLWWSRLNLEKATRCFHAWPLQGLSLRVSWLCPRFLAAISVILFQISPRIRNPCRREDRSKMLVKVLQWRNQRHWALYKCRKWH